MNEITPDWRAVQYVHTKGPPSTDPCDAHLDYFHIQAGEIGGDGWEISGYIPTTDARLITAAPKLFALVQRYAAECGDCNGQGYRAFAEAGAQDCSACRPMRTLIAEVKSDSLQFPTARSPIGPEPAKVASTAIVSLGSELWEPPTSAMSDVGVLENCAAVYVLTANENY